MLSVREICKIAGVTRKTLFHYDQIGLLKPTSRKGRQGAKLYDQEALRKLLEIRLYRFIGLPIEDIRMIMSGQTIIRETILNNHRNALLEDIKRQEEKSKIAQSIQTLSNNEFQSLLNSSLDLEQLKEQLLKHIGEK